MVEETIGHALDHLDPVVDAFDQIGAQWPAGVSENAWQVGLEPPGELAQRPDPAAYGAVVSVLRPYLAAKWNRS